MDIEKVITNIAGILGIISTIFTIFKSVIDFNEARKNNSPNTTQKEKSSIPSMDGMQFEEKKRRPIKTNTRTSQGKFLGIFLSPFGSVIIINLILYILMKFLGIQLNNYIFISILAIEVAITFILLDRWVYFLAQFILPIKTRGERKEIYKRVYTFGPILFIRNGRAVMSEHMMAERGYGVLSLDSASAAVLRTKTEIKETIGPGIKFTQPGEYLFGTIDLRTQQVFIGPLRAYQHIQDNTAQTIESSPTLGLTNDGVRVIPVISVTFRVKRPSAIKPGEPFSKFGLDINAVQRAITNKVKVINGTSIEWYSHPVQIAINLWKEYIKKFSFNDLHNQKNGIKLIEDLINQRLVQSQYLEIGDNGLTTGNYGESLEYKEIHSYGLEILRFQIHQVYFDQTVEEKIIRLWKSNNFTLARKESDQIREMELLSEKLAYKNARKLLVTSTTSRFDAKGGFEPNNVFILAQNLMSHLKVELSKNLFNEAASDTERELDNLSKWLLVKNTEYQNSSERRGKINE